MARLLVLKGCLLALIASAESECSVNDPDGELCLLQLRNTPAELELLKTPTEHEKVELLQKRNGDATGTSECGDAQGKIACHNLQGCVFDEEASPPVCVPKCDCISLPADIDYKGRPSTYGAECAPHDEGATFYDEPYCVGDEPQGWCSKSWCYVDPACPLSDLASTVTFQEEAGTMVYSYFNCGSSDTFTDWHWEAACAEATDEASCGAMEECAYAGEPKQCMIGCDCMSIPSGTDLLNHAADYGSRCHTPWDLGPGSSFEECNAENVTTDWCFKSWCYVEPDCHLPDVQVTTIFNVSHAMGDTDLIWSYANCGAQDTFTEDYCNGAADATACNVLSACSWNETENSCSHGPVDCEMSSWSVTVPCSVTCGAGVEIHTRSITTHNNFGGAPCGATEQEYICQEAECPGDQVEEDLATSAPTLTLDMTDFEACTTIAGKKVLPEKRPADRVDCPGETYGYPVKILWPSHKDDPDAVFAGYWENKELPDEYKYTVGCQDVEDADHCQALCLAAKPSAPVSVFRHTGGESNGAHKACACHTQMPTENMKGGSDFEVRDCTLS